MQIDEAIEYLKRVPTEILNEVVVRRHQELLRSEYGGYARFGFFKFIVHEGQFQTVEAWPRVRLSKSLRLQQRERYAA